jgi:hypothetical protein
MRAEDRVLRVLRPEMVRDGVLSTPPLVLSRGFGLSTPVRTPPKLSVCRIFGGGRVQKSGPLSSYDLFLGVFSMSNTILVDVQWLF